MSCENKEKSCGCIGDLLRKILMLQKQDFDGGCQATGCDKPYLGPVCNSVCYNTRPIMLFNCCTGEAWSFPYTINGVTNYSTVFRIESIDDCCATCRILYLNCENNENNRNNHDNYSGTSEFFTIDLNCVGAVKCLADTFIETC